MKFKVHFFYKCLQNTLAICLFCLVLVVLSNHPPIFANALVEVGAERTQSYLPYLKNKNVGLVVNPSSIINERHLVDTLVSLGIAIKKIYAPEHGFRGTGEAGEEIVNDIDKKTGIPVISIYGQKKKPAKQDLEGIEVMVFDLQDVGVRCYTYISTLHYIMEACAENQIELIVLDRPNPNGHYVDGPMWTAAYKSFVGMHPVPLVHGLTIGEYALMLNGEKLLKDSIQCPLKVIPMKGYSHRMAFCPAIKTSPNLPNMKAIYLYPSLVLFEGTKVSIGRGTARPFQVIGYPSFPDSTFSFTPVALANASTNPPYKMQTCYGYDLTKTKLEDLTKSRQMNLKWLLEMYQKYPKKEEFFVPFFNTLAGNATLKQQIVEGKTEGEIRAFWKIDIDKFKIIRKKYLLYKDFE